MCCDAHVFVSDGLMYKFVLVQQQQQQQRRKQPPQHETKTYVEDIVVVVDLDAGAGLVGTLDDGGRAAAGAPDGDGLLLGTVHLHSSRETIKR